MVEGSTCGRAGRFFLRMIFFIFLSAGAASSLLIVVRSVDVGSTSTFSDAVVGGAAVSMSAILRVVVRSWCLMNEVPLVPS